MRFMRGRRRWLGAAIMATPLACAAGCQSPTEVTLTVTTDVKCADFAGAAIAVGSPSDVESKAPATVTTTCSNSGSVGSLVIVPSGGDTDEITIRVAGGVDRDPTTCSDDADGAAFAGCIIARRSLRFEAHTPLVVALALESACAGVKCATDETCVAGACLSDVGDPDAVGDAGALHDGDATLGPVDEAGTPLPDAAGDAGDGSSIVTPPPGSTPFDAGPPPEAGSPSPACGGGSQPGAPWPSTRRCGTNDARSPFSGASSATPGMTCSTIGGGVLTPLAIDATNRVYMGGDDGMLRVFDADLALQASLALGMFPITSATIAADGTVYATGAAAGSAATYELRATAAGTFVLVGAVTTAGNASMNLPTPVPVVAASGALVTGTPTSLVAYGSGLASAPTWTFAPPADAGAASLVAFALAPDGTLLSAWNKVPVYAVDSAGAGAVVSDSDSPPGSLVGGLGHEYAWNKTSITVLDGAPAITSVIIGVALQSNAVVVASNPASGTGYGTGVISLLDPATLTTVSTPATISTRVSSPPVVDVDDNVYFVATDGRLHVHKGVSASTFRGASTATSSPAPIIGNGAVYLGGIPDGGVCVYR